MRSVNLLLLGILAIVGANYDSPLLALESAPQQKENCTIELISEAAVILSGEPFTVGIWIKMEPGWHTYWRDPGDSGMPTRVKWILPEGFNAGEIQWPIPKRFGDEMVTNFGYEKEVILLTEISPPESLAVGTKVPVTAKVSWLLVKDICIPEKAELTLRLPVEEASRLHPEWSKVIQETRRQIRKGENNESG